MTSRLSNEEPSQDFEIQSAVMQEGRAGRNLSQDCRKKQTSSDLLHLWISFFSIGIVALGGCMKTPSSEPNKTTTSSSVPSEQSASSATATPSDQSVSLDNIELQLKPIPSDGDVPQFDGTVVNTGKSEIDKVFLRIQISKMSITPEELRNSKLMAFRPLKNLKPGESRYVTLPLSIGNFCLAEAPKEYEKGVDYTVNWGENYKWSISALDQASLDVLSKDLQCPI